MGKKVLRDCQIIVNGVNLSDHVSQVTVNMVKEGVDTTNFSGGGREQVPGLKSDEFTVNFQQDFDAAQVDATLYPLYDLETEFEVEVRPEAGAVSATNPKYTGTCILLEYTPLDGEVGALSEASVTFPSQRSGIAKAIA